MLEMGGETVEYCMHRGRTNERGWPVAQRRTPIGSDDE